MLAYISGTNKPVNKYIEAFRRSRYGSLEHADRRRNEGTERKSDTASEGPKEIVT